MYTDVTRIATLVVEHVQSIHHSPSRRLLDSSVADQSASEEQVLYR